MSRGLCYDEKVGGIGVEAQNHGKIEPGSLARTHCHGDKGAGLMARSLCPREKVGGPGVRDQF